MFKPHLQNLFVQNSSKVTDNVKTSKKLDFYLSLKIKVSGLKHLLLAKLSVTKLWLVRINNFENRVQTYFDCKNKKGSGQNFYFGVLNRNVLVKINVD